MTNAKDRQASVQESSEKTSAGAEEIQNTSPATGKPDDVVGAHRRALFAMGLKTVAAAFAASACDNDKSKFGRKSPSETKAAPPAESPSKSGQVPPDTSNAVPEPEAPSDDEQPRTGEPPSTDEAPSTGEPPQGNQDPKVEPLPPGKCDATNKDVLKDKTLAKSTGALLSTVVMYGQSASALIVVHFADAVSPAISACSIAKEDGTLIATHAMTSADLMGTQYLPITFDGIRAAGANLKILVQSADVWYEQVAPVSFSKSYKGVSVQELAVGSVDAQFFKYQGIPNFGATAGGNPALTTGFKTDSARIYPGTAGGQADRFLVTAQAAATFTPAPMMASLSGDVTDMAGRLIGTTADFKDIVKYPMFIVYILASGIYYRSIIRMG